MTRVTIRSGRADGTAGRRAARPAVAVDRLEGRRLLSGTIAGTVGGTGGHSTTVYLDANGDGKLTAGEARTTTRASDGTFAFAGLAAGDYAVRQVDPAGYVQVVVSTATAGDVYGDGEAGVARVADGATATVTFGDARNVGSVDGVVFLNGVNAGVAGVTVYADLNGNAKLDPGEPSDVTAPDREGTGLTAYLLTGLPAGGDVVVRQVVPAGYVADGGVTSLTVGVAVADTTYAGPFYDSAAPTVTPLVGRVTGTAGSYRNRGNTAARAADGNLSTYVDAPAANGDTVGLDLGARAAITSVAYASRPGYAARMDGGSFQASNSPTFAAGDVTLFTIPADADPPSSELTTQSVVADGTYRYVRYVAPDGSFGNIAELQLAGTAGTARLAAAASGTAGSYRGYGNTAAKAADGNPATFVDGARANGNVVGLDLGSAKVVSQVMYAPRAGYAFRMVGGRFEASNSSTFANGTVAVYTIAAAPADGGLTAVGTGTATAYRYWRYVSPAGSNGNVAEFELFA